MAAREKRKKGSEREKGIIRLKKKSQKCSIRINCTYLYSFYMRSLVSLLNYLYQCNGIGCRNKTTIQSILVFRTITQVICEFVHFSIIFFFMNKIINLHESKSITYNNKIVYFYNTKNFHKFIHTHTLN